MKIELTLKQIEAIDKYEMRLKCSRYVWIDKMSIEDAKEKIRKEINDLINNI